MGKIVQTLEQKRFSLLVSLPANSMDLAKAAMEGGADAIKVHINVEHRASGASFGSLKDNVQVIETLIHTFDGPVGVVVGDSIDKVDRAEIDELIQICIDFISLYGHHTPAYLLGEKKLSKMIAINHEYSAYEIESFNHLPIDIVEASIIPGEQYGTKLSARDLMQYYSIVSRVHKPVIVPSQRKIEIEDLAGLLQTGVTGVMIGAIVTGATEKSMYEATRSFREKIDWLLKGGDDHQ